MSDKRILLALSGGVDSCAAAILLKKQGYDVVALFFDVLGAAGKSKDALDAERVAKELGIEFIYKNVADSFEKQVLSYFCDEYKCGRTPSPCVVCNPTVKFKTVCDAADELGIEKIATGHYVRLVFEDGVFYPAIAANKAKDQSYMLCRMPQEILRRCVFPLADFESKDELRKIVKDAGIDIFEKHDSQDLCFVPDGDYKGLLGAKNALGKAGNIICNNSIVGKHSGISGFTIGQRKGLGVAVGRPIFVTSIDAKTGDVFLGDEEALFRREVEIKDLFFFKKNVLFQIQSDNITKTSAKEESCGKCDTSAVAECCDENEFDFEKTYYCKLRYSAKAAKCRLTKKTDNSFVLIFDDPQRGPTPGQAAVLYDEDKVVASGFIKCKIIPITS